MADRLVKWLNDKGYQPVYVPATGLVPPELYTFAKGHLVRLGPLASYLRADTPLPKNSCHKLPDIQLVQTTEKSLKGAIKFLGNALRCLGFSGAPGLDFVFSGDGQFLFNLTQVTTEETDLAAIQKLLNRLDTTLLSSHDIQEANLHVAYSYAYAASLEVRSSDQSDIEAKVSGGEIENVVEIGTKGNMRVKKGNELVFKPRKADRVAFAYKAARLIPSGVHYELRPEDVKHFAASGEGGYVPNPGVPLTVEDRAAT